MGHRRALVTLRAGTVKLADAHGLHTGLQVEDEPMVFLPPATTALMFGALRRSHHDMIAECAPLGGQLGHVARVGR